MRTETRHQPRQGIWIVLLALVAAVLTPSPADAGPPIRESQDSLVVQCGVDDTTLQFWAVQLDDGTGFLDVVVEWPDGLAFGSSEDAVVGATTATAEMDLVRPDDRVTVGTVAIDVELTPTGDVETSGDRLRYGNVLERFEETAEAAVVSGSIVVEGDLAVVIDPGVDCTGDLHSYSFFVTSPATFVDRFDNRYLDCAVIGGGAFGSMFAFADGDASFVDLYLDTPDGAVFGSAEDATFTAEALSAAFEVYRFDSGPGEEPQPAGTALVDASLTVQETTEERTQTPRETVRVVTDQLAVEGTVTIGDATYDLDGCWAEASSGFVRSTSVNRGGRPAPNDAPEDAAPLAVPGSAAIATGATADEPEASCTVTFDGFEDELPITNTVWYLVEGTGGPVTIDTATSDFDTIVGVYTQALDQLACVDDVDSFQARVTVETVAGQIYLVQIGGFAGSTGRLEVTTDG